MASDYDVVVGSSQNVIVSADSSSQVVVTATETTPEITVESPLVGIPGPQGKMGGNVPITVSITPPVDPDENDLWIEIS